MDAPVDNGVSELEPTLDSAQPASEPLDLGFTGSSMGATENTNASAESVKELEKMREKATQDRDQFYAEREKKIAAKKKQALDEQSMTTEATVKSGWEGVVELIELDQSKSEGRHDLSAMKSLLITLKHKGSAKF